MASVVGTADVLTADSADGGGSAALKPVDVPDTRWEPVPAGIVSRSVASWLTSVLVRTVRSTCATEWPGDSSVWASEFPPSDFQARATTTTLAMVATTVAMALTAVQLTLDREGGWAFSGHCSSPTIHRGYRGPIGRTASAAPAVLVATASTHAAPVPNAAAIGRALAPVAVL